MRSMLRRTSRVNIYRPARRATTAPSTPSETMASTDIGSSQRTVQLRRISPATAHATPARPYSDRRSRTGLKRTAKDVPSSRVFEVSFMAPQLLCQHSSPAGAQTSSHRPFGGRLPLRSEQPKDFPRLREQVRIRADALAPVERADQRDLLVG